MYEDLRAAVELLKEYCVDHRCCECPLCHVICHVNNAINPCSYSLPRFDLNVEELESGADHD